MRRTFVCVVSEYGYRSVAEGGGGGMGALLSLSSEHVLVIVEAYCPKLDLSRSLCSERSGGICNRR